MDIGLVWHGHESKQGGLRQGHELKKGGGPKNWFCKKDNLMLHKRGFWELIYYLPLLFSCQHDQLVGVCSDRLTKRGQVKKGGLYYGTYLYWIYM